MINVNMDRKKFLRELKGRSALILNDECREKAQNFFAEAEKVVGDEARDRDFFEKCKAARKNPEIADELARLRVNTVQNFVLASTNAGTFFNSVTLGADEIPYIENTTRQEISVSYIGQDGREHAVQARKPQSQTRVDLHAIATDDYEYRLVDMMTGDIKGPSLANVFMNYDLTQAIDQKLWPYVTGAVGAFVTTGPKEARTYLAHSSVNPANLPTTNLLTPAGNTTSTMWRKECMDKVLTYSGQWGSNAFVDGAIAPQVVFIPSSHIFGWLEQVSLTSEGNALVTQIFENGYVLNYGGTSWTLVGDSTLDPDAGMAYVRTNKAIGDFYTKPTMDNVIVDDSPKLRKQNKESVSMMKVMGAGLPSPWKVNMIGVQYRTAS